MRKLRKRRVRHMTGPMDMDGADFLQPQSPFGSPEVEDWMAGKSDVQVLTAPPSTGS